MSKWFFEYPNQEDGMRKFVFAAIIAAVSVSNADAFGRRGSCRCQTTYHYTCTSVTSSCCQVQHPLANAVTNVTATVLHPFAALQNNCNRNGGCSSCPLQNNSSQLLHPFDPVGGTAPKVMPQKSVDAPSTKR